MCDIVIVFTVYLTLYLSLVQLYFAPTDRDAAIMPAQFRA